MSVEESPTLGAVYMDHQGRRLEVNFVAPGDPLGREVLGNIEQAVGLVPPAPNETITRRYSCTLVDWARTWRDKAAPWRGKS